MFQYQTPPIALRNLQAASQRAAKLWAPPPDLTISEWADQHRQLSAESTAEPGQWYTSRAEYQRGIMDAFSDATVQDVVVMSSAQVGKTEILNNVVAYFVDQDPSPMLCVQPTLEMGEAWSKDRLAPMLRDTICLRGKVKDPRSRDSGNTLLHKIFPGGHITVAGSNSAASLASRPIRIVLCDEVDRYPASAGTEGDPVNLALQRSANFWNRKHGLFSTPTIKDASRIEAAYRDSDQRRYAVPCGDCGEFQYLSWGQVKYQDDDPATAAYECQFCKARWNDGTRYRAVRLGRWQPSAPFNGTAGFHLNAIYSPWVSLSSLVKDWFAAQSSPERLKTFVNTKLGETWEERHEAQTNPQLLLSRCEAYADEDGAPTPVPERVVILTAGVDIQADRIEAEVIGWGRDEESWSLGYFVIPGDTARTEVWRDLDELLSRVWDHPLGLKFRLHAACIDRSYNDAMVQRFLRTTVNRRVFAIVGRAGAVPIWPRKPSHAKGSVFYLVGIDAIKDAIGARLRLAEHGPGYMHFAIGPNYDLDHFEQLTAERKFTVYHHGFPRREWRKKEGARNEALDCRVYGYAALHALYASGLRLNAESDRLGRMLAQSGRTRAEVQAAAPAAGPGEPPPPPPRSTPARGPRIIGRFAL